MLATTCPPRKQLQNYLAGKLEESDSEVLEQHLQSCQVCEQTALEIDQAPDSLVELLQDSVPPADQVEGEPGDPSSAATSSGGDPASSYDPVLQPQSSVWPHSLAMPTAIASYELLKQLGNGGMGAVYLARHKKLDKLVAIKLLPALPARMPEFVARFQREMRAAGQLAHPAIVRSTDAGEEQGIHFLVMDAIDGLDLSRIARAIDKTGIPFSIADACEIARQTAMGLSHAHEKGIVHRDIKPSNLMLDAEGQVKILDFGLAQVGIWDHGSAEITSVGQLMGTLDYMAPEQAERSGSVDYRADLYSLGATLFRLLTGRPPLAATPDLTPLEKLRLLSTHHAPKLSTLRGDAPQALSQLLETLLARDPSQRPASAAHAAELLEPFCVGAELTALVARARAIPSEAEAPQAPAMELVKDPLRRGVLPSSTMPSSSVSDMKTSSSGGWGVATWVALAISLGLLCAGILIVLETSKGQLVIESDNVALQVNLLKDGEQTQELQIEPGAQSTRLRAGQYEIVIDSPSDNFSISNRQFAIHNGQTVVARITTKDKQTAGVSGLAASEAAVAAKDSRDTAPSNDKRLDEVVFDGATLDVWLRRLKFERSEMEQMKAIVAISAIADDSVRDLIEPVIVQALPAMSGGSLNFGLSLLKKSSAQANFYDNLAQILTAAKDVDRQAEILSALIRVYPLTPPHASQELDSLLAWASGVLQDGSSQPHRRMLTAEFLSKLLNNPERFGQPACVECQQSVLAVLRSSPYLSDEGFWLAKTEDPEGDASQRGGMMVSMMDSLKAEYRDGDDPQRGLWSDPFRQEIRQHAIQAIADEDTTPQMVAQAALVLASTAKYHAELTEDQQTQLIAALARRLELATEAPAADLPLVSLPRTIREGAAPILPNADWTLRDQANPLTVLLNLIVKFPIEAELQPELTALHQAFASLPLAGPEYNEVAQNITRPAYMYDHPQFRQHILQQIVFVQSGHLIGKSTLELVSRFEQILPVDQALEVKQILDVLEFGPKDEVITSLRRLSQVPIGEHADRAIPLLKKIILGNYKHVTDALTLLSRASGDQFVVHYAELLEKSSPSVREQLLGLEFAGFVEFRCQAPQALTPLLSWTDSIFASSSDEDVAQQMAVAGMLKSLLRDRSATIAKQKRQGYELAAGTVSEECQRVILDHLQNYSQLDDLNFWLAEPVAGSATHALDFPFAQVMVERALRAMEDDSVTPTAERLRAQAAMAIRIAQQRYDQRELLSSEQRTQLVELLARQLKTAAEDLPAAAQFFEVDDRFAVWVHPMIGSKSSAANVERQSYRFPKCNPLIVTLNLIDQLGVQTELVEPLKLLHAAATVQQSTRNDPTPEGQSPRERLLGSAKPSDYAGQLVHEVIYLQTGLLLGQDYQELIDRHNRIRREQEQVQQRFVQPRDTLAISIPGVLPAGGVAPPVIQAGSRSPVTGFPVPVSAEGTINLPDLPPVSVKDQDLDAVRELIKKSYSDVNGKPIGSISVEFLMRAGEEIELRRLTETVPAN